MYVFHISFDLCVVYGVGSCTRVWVLLWLCMLRVSFFFVSPMLLMFVLSICIVLCVLCFGVCEFEFESRS